MFIIVGLGNPGREYENTRHNVGFMTVDMLADRFNIEVKRHNFRAVFGEGYIGGQKVVLAKPETYMNLSGWSVMGCATGTSRSMTSCCSYTTI